MATDLVGLTTENNGGYQSFTVNTENDLPGDFALLSRLYHWDHIPGVFILRQAGGHDCHFDKLEYKFYENSKNLVVSSSKNLSYDILNLI